MTSENGSGIEVKKLGVLPIIRHFLNRLGVREIIDGHTPKPGSEVSNGECIEALLMAIFLDKEHALSRVGGLLDGYDLTSLFRPSVTANHFHDTRLGECLDDLYERAPTIYGDIVAKAIREFKLVIRKLNLDASKILLHGDYRCFEDYMEHADTVAFPDRGWNPEGRLDLKQLLLELVNTEENIPLLYAVGNGNASETKEYLRLMQRLDTIQADVSKAVLAVDSKACAPATLAEAALQKLRLVTLVPETYSLREKLVTQAATEELPILLRTEDGVEYRGRSFRIPSLIDFEREEITETHGVLWRYLVVYSSQKAEQEVERRNREIQDEREELEKKLEKFSRTKLFACETDATQEIAAWVKGLKLSYHNVSGTPRAGVVQKGRGRPSGNGTKTSDREGWGVAFTFEAIKQPDFKYDPDAMFVLLTTVNDGRVLNDTDLLEGYRGRNIIPDFRVLIVHSG